MHKDHCEGCGVVTPGYDTVNYGSIEKGYRRLCTLCFNAEVAKMSGLDDFENIRLEPIGIADSSGKLHLFHFQMRPKPRIEDWRVQMNGLTVGSVWRCGDGYLVSVAVKQFAPTQDAAFKAARKQLRELTRHE